MTDRQDPQDQRDTRLAEALAVLPLDDVTRRRLVRNALGAAESEPATPSRRSWVPVAAAAVVILLVVGFVVALSQSGDESTSDVATREQRAPAASAVPGAESDTGSAASAADSAGAAAPLTAGTRLYGDLGDLSIPATRNSVREAIRSSNPPTGPVAESVAGRVAEADCAASLRTEGTRLIGLGTATVEGHDAAVVVTRAADGGDTASVLVFSPCSVTRL